MILPSASLRNGKGGLSFPLVGRTSQTGQRGWRTSSRDAEALRRGPDPRQPLRLGEDSEAFGSRIYASTIRLATINACAHPRYPLRRLSAHWRLARCERDQRSAQLWNDALACLSASPCRRSSPSVNLLSLADPSASATSVRAEGTQVICRLYAATGEPAAAKIDGDGLSIVELRTLAGERSAAPDPVHDRRARLVPARRRAGQ